MESGARGFSFGRSLINDRNALLELLFTMPSSDTTNGVSTTMADTTAATTEAITNLATTTPRQTTASKLTTIAEITIYNQEIINTTSTSSIFTKMDLISTSTGLNLTTILPNFTSTISSNTKTFQNQLLDDEVLCGRPIFLSDHECHTFQSSSTLWECSNQPAAVFYLIFFTLLGIAILFLNFVLPYAVFRLKPMRTRSNYLKVSLAISDMLFGFICLGDFLPNAIAFLNQDYRATVINVLTSLNQPHVSASAFIIALTFQLSVLHLLVMHVERLAAIIRPFSYRTMTRMSLIVEITAIWIVSIALSVVQVTMPSKWTLLKSHVIFISVPFDSIEKEDDDPTSLLYTIFTIVLPLAIAIIITAITGTLIIHKLGISKRMRATFILQKAERKQRKMTIQMRANEEIKQETSVFVTTVLMVSAFCITWVPFIVLSTAHDHLDCDEVSIPYTISFILLCFNCLANPIIYTIRDEKIRSCLRRVLTTCKTPRQISSSLHTAKTLRTNVDPA